MIGITRLYCGAPSPGDDLRYVATTHRRPVIVWNCTRRCNLGCVHCYSESENKPYPNELTTQEARTLIEDLAEFGSPVLLFSGGEPLLRRDIFELAPHAKELGLRPVLSTNGTLITKETAERLKTAGFAYAGISLDGVGETNDKFRGRQGAFEAAVQGIRNCMTVGLKAGLRFTLTRHNLADIPGIFKLIEEERIPRLCFYHLVYAGRGSSMTKDDLTHEETQRFMEMLLAKAREFDEKGLGTEILTVDNHADAVYLLMKLGGEDSERRSEAQRLLKMNGGNSSGLGIGCVDSSGDVHPDQFWRHYTLGNVRTHPLSEIWTDGEEPILKGLRDRRKLLKGRCALCRYLEVCNGNFRVRAEAVYGDVWAPDPACYLTDEEIGLA